MHLKMAKNNQNQEDYKPNVKDLAKKFEIEKKKDFQLNLQKLNSKQNFAVQLRKSHLTKDNEIKEFLVHSIKKNAFLNKECDAKNEELINAKTCVKSAELTRFNKNKQLPSFIKPPSLHLQSLKFKQSVLKENDKTKLHTNFNSEEKKIILNNNKNEINKISKPLPKINSKVLNTTNISKILSLKSKNQMVTETKNFFAIEEQFQKIIVTKETEKNKTKDIENNNQKQNTVKPNLPPKPSQLVLQKLALTKKLNHDSTECSVNNDLKTHKVELPANNTKNNNLNKNTLKCIQRPKIKPPSPCEQKNVNLTVEKNHENLSNDKLTNKLNNSKNQIVKKPSMRPPPPPNITNTNCKTKKIGVNSSDAMFSDNNKHDFQLPSLPTIPIPLPPLQNFEENSNNFNKAVQSGNEKVDKIYEEIQQTLNITMNEKNDFKNDKVLLPQKHDSEKYVPKFQKNTRGRYLLSNNYRNINNINNDTFFSVFDHKKEKQNNKELIVYDNYYAINDTLKKDINLQSICSTSLEKLNLNSNNCFTTKSTDANLNDNLELLNNISGSLTLPTKFCQNLKNTIRSSVNQKSTVKNCTSNKSTKSIYRQARLQRQNKRFDTWSASFSCYESQKKNLNFYKSYFLPKKNTDTFLSKNTSDVSQTSEQKTILRRPLSELWRFKSEFHINFFKKIDQIRAKVGNSEDCNNTNRSIFYLTSNEFSTLNNNTTNNANNNFDSTKNTFYQQKNFDFIEKSKEYLNSNNWVASLNKNNEKDCFDDKIASNITQQHCDLLTEIENEYFELKRKRNKTQNFSTISEMQSEEDKDFLSKKYDQDKNETQFPSCSNLSSDKKNLSQDLNFSYESNKDFEDKNMLELSEKILPLKIDNQESENEDENDFELHSLYTSRLPKPQPLYQYLLQREQDILLKEQKKFLKSTNSNLNKTQDFDSKDDFTEKKDIKQKINLEENLKTINKNTNCKTICDKNKNKDFNVLKQTINEDNEADSVVDSNEPDDVTSLLIRRQSSSVSTDSGRGADTVSRVTSNRSMRRERFTAGSIYGSQRSLWCELPEVKSAGLLELLDKNSKRLQEAYFEVITSEASYLRSINFLITHFMAAPELMGSKSPNSVITSADRKQLFSNILAIRDCSEKLLCDLENRLKENLLLSDVCDILCEHFEKHFDAYVKYCSNQVYQDRTLKRLKLINSQFINCIQKIELNRQCQGLDMRSFLMLPMQRITRYPLLVYAILDSLDSSTQQHSVATRALLLANQVVRNCNEGARKMERTEQLLEIERRLVYKSTDLKKIPLVSSGRYVVKSGPVTQLLEKSKNKTKINMLQTKQKSQGIFFFLFNDLLLIAKRKPNGTFVCKDYAARRYIVIEPVEPYSHKIPAGAISALTKKPHLFFCILMQNSRGKQVELLLNTESESDRERWLSAMRPPTCANPEEKIYAEWDCPQAIVVHNYEANQEDELTLESGDLVNILRKMSDGWFYGEIVKNNKNGWFPSSYVQLIFNDHVRANNYRQRLRVIQAAADYRNQQQHSIKNRRFSMNAKQTSFTNSNVHSSISFSNYEQNESKLEHYFKTEGYSERVFNRLRRLSNPKSLFMTLEIN